MSTDEATAAGTSARREYERRKANDEAKIRAKWGRLGGIAVALTDEKQSTTAWATGARGEELVGGVLDRIASEGIRVLHDRRIPGSKANIDHIAVTPAGVWVIDAKRYKGKRPELVVEGGIIRPRVEKLLVGRRDETRLVEGVLKQIAAMQAALPSVPVRGALCFVDADWPLFGGEFRVGDVDVLWPKKLAAKVTGAEAKKAETPAADVDVAAVMAVLEKTFKPA